MHYERATGSPTTEASGEAGKISDRSPTPTGSHERPGNEVKRKYRRHPKPDRNAPDRPPSAYVIFSNKIREEVRGENLSFTDIAKLVGDRWQNLTSNAKEPFESQANRAKDRFNAQLAQYKKTDSYQEYNHYIAEFKAKHGGSTIDGKRAKLEQDSNCGNGSFRANEIIVEARPKVALTHARDISVGSVNSVSYHGSNPSPKGSTTALSPTMMGYSISTHLSRISSSPTTNSPPLRPDHREGRLQPVPPVHGSLPPEAHQFRGDFPDLQSRSSQLSLAPHSNTTTLPTADSADSAFTNRQSAAALVPPPLHHQGSVSSVACSNSSGTSSLPGTPADEPWRFPPPVGKAKNSEWPRIYNPLLANSYSVPFGQLAPLQASDRVSDRIPDITCDPTQRALPFPAVSSPRDLKTSFRGHLQNSILLRPSGLSDGNPSEFRDEMKSPLENSENDAANALAGLAYTGR